MRGLFGAHESFHIREGWLRKGLVAIHTNPFLFSDPYPADALGVGHNMVAAIRYWLQATGLAHAQPELRDGRKVARFAWTPLAELIHRQDPYFEEDGTLWILHYQLATNKTYAPTWYWFFNLFGVRHFTQELFLSHLQRHVDTDLRRKISARTLEKEFRCLVRTYARSEDRGKRGSIEDSYDCPLANLNLLEPLPLTKAYRLVSPQLEGLHPLLVAYALAQMGVHAPLLRGEVSLRDALYEPGSPGRIYILDSETLYEYLVQLEAEHRDLIAFSRTAGLNVITLRVDDPLSILSRYYEAVKLGIGVHA